MTDSLSETGMHSSCESILLLGKNGQVGGDLLPLLRNKFEVFAPGRHDLNLLQPDRVRESVRSFHPGIIVNAAAYTAVDKAEKDVETAMAINATAPGVLAEEAKHIGALLIHYSTDYVFDGLKPTPYVETDHVSPLNVYGKSKADGEKAVRDSGCRHLILRTSWVFSDRGANFVHTILRLAREREELRIVDDQIGSPTSSRSLAVATDKLLSQPLLQSADFSDTYHVSDRGYVSWFSFAEEILRLGPAHDRLIKRVKPIPSSEYPTPARRPLNSRLDCSRFTRDFGIEMPSWRSELEAVLAILSKAPAHRVALDS